MNTAVVTFVYNESVNLPIWRRYYGAIFGEENLFVVDRGSTDGSTENLGRTNRLLVPRGPFDDVKKSDCLSALHLSLLQHYDVVIVSDCDEIIVPDPQFYSNLSEYLEKNRVDYINCIGLDIFHIINAEGPLDIDRPILSQRSIASFRSDACKPLISSIPIKWAPGGHACDKPPKFDPNLFMFHLKFMDYSIAMKRQIVNRETKWSDQSLAGRHGAHHRYDNARFVREGFLDPLNAANSDRIETFDFSQEIEKMLSQTIKHGDIYIMPNNILKIVKVPERFSKSL